MTAPIRKLAIVGAGARAAAFSALRAGYEVVAADLFADADLARVAPVTRITGYPDGLADWLAATECDAWMYTGALENFPDLVDRMAALRPLVGNGGAALRSVRDPLTLQSACREAGVAFPETRATADELPFDGSWLCKTYRGSSGSGVWRLDGRASLDRAQQQGAAFQRELQGEAAAAIFVARAEGAQLVGVTRQLLGKREGHEWQYAGSLGPLAVGTNIAKQIEAIGSVAAQQFGLRGLIGADFVVDAHQAALVEINPRYTASVEIVERLIDKPLTAAHVAACAGARDAPPHASSPGDALPEGRTHYAKSILYARRDVLIAPLFFNWAMHDASLDPMHRVLADVPNERERIPAGRPVLTVLATGSSTADCQRRLGERLAEVESHLYRGQ